MGTASSYSLPAATNYTSPAVVMIFDLIIPISLNRLGRSAYSKMAFFKKHVDLNSIEKLEWLIHGGSCRKASWTT